MKGEKEMTRCISMGRGSKEHPHFYFLDCDVKGEHILNVLRENCPNALIYSTRRGFHVVDRVPIIREYGNTVSLSDVYDHNCPFTAVRIYPYEDYEIKQFPSGLCIRVAGIYQAIFGRVVDNNPQPCTHGQPLKFGIYTTEDEKGKKLTGWDRVPSWTRP